MRKISCFLGFLISMSVMQVQAQFTQSIAGQVSDKESKAPLHGAVISVIGTDSSLITTSGPDGKFILADLKYGKYDIKVDFMGYESLVIPQVTVAAGKETMLNLEMTESVTDL